MNVNVNLMIEPSIMLSSCTHLRRHVVVLEIATILCILKLILQAFLFYLYNEACWLIGVCFDSKI